MKPKILLYGCPEKFENYRRALESAGARALFSGNGALSESCDGLLLAGGGDMDPAYYGQSPAGAYPPDRDRDAQELELLDSFAAAGKPVLGICRGVQVLNVYFGGTLIQDLPGHNQIDGTDRLHTVTAEPGCFLEKLYGVCSVVNSAHHQAIDRPGDGLRILQRADDGVTEALAHTVFPMFGVQWHPERLTGPFFRPDAVDGSRIFDCFLSYFR